MLTKPVTSLIGSVGGGSPAMSGRLGEEILTAGHGRCAGYMRENRQARAAAEVAGCAGGASGGVWSGAT